jgi:hypothetical protein
LPDNVRDPVEVHAARLLLLIDVFSTKRGGSVDGLGKLARLDFLLRYPVVLQEVLATRQRPLPLALHPTESETLALESAMIRWKYGPWDHRYYPLIGRLLSRELIWPLQRQQPMSVQVTEAGRAAAARLTGPAWDRVRCRAEALRRSLNVSATQIGELIARAIEAEGGDLSAIPFGRRIE